MFYLNFKMWKNGKIMLFILKEIYCLEDLKKKNYEKIIKVVCCFFFFIIVLFEVFKW